MNNIYKVIWSKAKNCYVVASEIAKSHTKSASGSEKMGGYGKKALLALAAASAIFCGGLVNVGATVHVNEGTGVTSEVYTTGETYNKTEVDNALTAKGAATDVATNKADIANLKTAVGDAGSGLTKAVADQKADIATNRANINNLDGKLANLTTTVNGKADEADVNNKLAQKANQTAVTALDGRVGSLETTVGDASSGLVKDVADLKNQGNDLNTAIGNKADQSGLDAATNRISTNEGNITALQTKTAKLSDDGTELNGMTTVGTGALKVTGGISNGTGVTTTLTDIKASMDKANANETAIGQLQTTTTNQQTAIDGLNKKTTKITYDASNGTSVDGVTFNAGAVTGVTSINGTVIGTKESGTYIHQDSSIWGNMKNVDTQVTTNADNIKKNKDDITALDTKVGTVGVGTYLDSTKSVGENLGRLNAGLEKEVGDRTAAVDAEKAAREAEDSKLSDRIGTVAEDGKYIKKSATNNVSENLIVLDTQAKTNAEAIAKETADRRAAIGELAVNGNYIEKDKNVSNNLVKLDNQAKANADEIVKTNERTGGIARNLEGTQTTIEGSVKVDKQGNVKEVKGLSAETITTSGNADLKGNVTLGTTAANTVTVNGTADFNEAVNMDKGLTVTNGETNLKKTKVDGDLTVTGTITTDKMIFGDKATNNYTEIDKGHITSKNDVLAGDATKKSSSMELDHSKLEVGVTDKDSNGHLTMTADQTSIKNSDLDGKNYSEIVADKDSVKTTVKDEKDNTTSTKSSATEIRNYAKDKDGNESSIVQTGKDITNTAEKGTITNTAKDIVNNATGDMKNDVGGKLTTTVAGQATENFNGGLNTTVNGAENHTVTGKQINTVGGGQKNIISGGQINNITGDQTTTVTGGNISNKAEKITNEANTELTDKVGTNTRVTTSTSITDTVGTANRKIEDGKITDTAGDFTVTTEKTKGTTFAKTGSTTAFSTEAGAPTDTNIAGNLITTGRVDANELGVSDKDGDNTSDFSVEAGVGKGVKASAGDGTTTGSLDVTAKEVGSSVKDDASGKGSTFKQRIDVIMGKVKTDAGESEVTQTGDEITSKVGLGEATNSRVTQKKDLLEAAVTDGTNYNISNDTANASAKVLTDGTKVNQLQDNLYSSEKMITNGTYTTSKLQTALDITNTAKDGTITNDAKDIVNNASGNMTNTVGGDLTTTVAGNELHEVTGNKTENVTGKVTENYGNGQETNVTGDQYLHVTGKQTNKIDGNQENTIGGNQTTTVTGDISNKAENITNEANTKLTDKVGDHTRVLDGDGITDTVGGSTFKQRIDKIMMESKDVSIKAEETLTNEAKVITNKASEVINNEAVNINNTATGIITSKASEIKNQADKLISNKVGENTWENMENGKITTSIKDGAKQNLTQSDAAGTTQSTVDGGKSTVTIQNADGLADAVTNGTNTSVQNQTASAIAAAVKDGAGNENASVANATTSANTIKSGSKANTVISTADGTSFINSEAAAPVGDGTAVNTTIKGNTITTGKVTMDYAEVMKDLGVHGNAKVDQNLEVGGTSTLKGDVTMESNATVKKDLKVEGTTTTKTLKVTENAEIDGTLKVSKKATFEDSVSIAKDLSVGGDVTAKSYKVGDKTYIDANGIHANDQKITNVADGSISEGSKDAVNGGQLYGVKRDLEHQVDKVGANAAAMANLRPMEFDPSSKWNIAAAIGNYGSETAAALGAFYRPNDDVMVNLSTAFGTGENMVGGGVSVRLGKGGNKLSREETNALKDQVNDLTARMDALLSVLNPNMSKDFPDVPENHWAYEAVSRLAGNDIVQGYPDGEFHGERTMTRYEMAEIIYNALSRGAEAEKELVEEFKPELQAMAASEKATAEKAEG
jgi:hypothetical protein